MKRIITAICFIVFAFSVGIISLFAIINGCDTITSILSEALDAAETEDAKRVNALSVKLDDEWKRKKILFHILIDHNEMDGIESGIEKIKYYSEKGEYKLVFTISEDCRANFNHIKESAEPSISNIF